MSYYYILFETIIWVWEYVYFQHKDAIDIRNIIAGYIFKTASKYGLMP